MYLVQNICLEVSSNHKVFPSQVSIHKSCLPTPLEMRSQSLVSKGRRPVTDELRRTRRRKTTEHRTWGPPTRQTSSAGSASEAVTRPLALRALPRLPGSHSDDLPLPSPLQPHQPLSTPQLNLHLHRRPSNSRLKAHPRENSSENGQSTFPQLFPHQRLQLSLRALLLKDSTSSNKKRVIHQPQLLRTDLELPPQPTFHLSSRNTKTSTLKYLAWLQNRPTDTTQVVLLLHPSLNRLQHHALTRKKVLQSYTTTSHSLIPALMETITAALLSGCVITSMFLLSPKSKTFLARTLTSSLMEPGARLAHRIITDPRGAKFLPLLLIEILTASPMNRRRTISIRTKTTPPLSKTTSTAPRLSPPRQLIPQPDLMLRTLIPLRTIQTLGSMLSWLTTLKARKMMDSTDFHPGKMMANTDLNSTNASESYSLAPTLWISLPVATGFLTTRSPGTSPNKHKLLPQDHSDQHRLHQALLTRRNLPTRPHLPRKPQALSAFLTSTRHTRQQRDRPRNLSYPNIRKTTNHRGSRPQSLHRSNIHRPTSQRDKLQWNRHHPSFHKLTSPWGSPPWNQQYHSIPRTTNQWGSPRPLCRLDRWSRDHRLQKCRRPHPPRYTRAQLRRRRDQTLRLRNQPRQPRGNRTSRAQPERKKTIATIMRTMTQTQASQSTTT